MRDVVLDRLDSTSKDLAWKRLRQMGLDARPLAHVADSLLEERDIGNLGQRKRELPSEIGFGVVIDRDAIDVGNLELRLCKAVANGLARKSGPVLDTAKALFLGRGDDVAFLDEARRRIAVESVDSEDRRHREVRGWSERISLLSISIRERIA